MTQAPLLAVDDLHLAAGAQGPFLLSGVTLSVGQGDICGLVGETGSGKSLTAWSILGLLAPPLRITAGSVVFDGEDLVSASPARLRQLRGNDVALVVQNPSGALDPMRTVGDQLANVYRVHRGGSARDSRDRAHEMLAAVGLRSALADSYVYQLSGGMAQRVVIAMALVNKPRLVIADEPTTGLDVTVQAEVLDLLREMVRQSGSSALIITHDLGIVAHYCDRAAVMFAGRVVEETTVPRFFRDPQHPYTRALVSAAQGAQARDGRSEASMPSPAARQWSSRCEYVSRCSQAAAVCQTAPHLRELDSGRRVLCHLPWEAA